jgi:hypothetical protein
MTDNDRHACDYTGWTEEQIALDKELIRQFRAIEARLQELDAAGDPQARDIRAEIRRPFMH